MPFDPRRVKRLKRCHLALIWQKIIFKRKLILHSLVDAPPTNPKKGCVNGHILSIKKIYRAHRCVREVPAAPLGNC